MNMENKKINETDLDKLSYLPDEVIFDIACDVLDATSHEVRATSEGVRASLARMDAMDKLADLYHQVRHDYQI